MTKESRLRVSRCGVSLLYLGRCLRRQRESRGTIEQNHNRAGEWDLRACNKRRLSVGTSWCGRHVQASRKGLGRDVILMLVYSKSHECVILEATRGAALFVGISYFLLRRLRGYVKGHI